MKDKSVLSQFSLTPSDSSLCSPRYSITIADDSIPPEVERDFFSQLYGGETAGLDAGNIPEEYYTYLEGWYHSQVSAMVTERAAGALPPLHTSLTSPFSLHPVPASCPPEGGLVPGPPPSYALAPSSTSSSQIFIPVSTLQSLRASEPSHLHKLSSSAGRTNSQCSSSRALPRCCRERRRSPVAAFSLCSFSLLM